MHSQQVVRVSALTRRDPPALGAVTIRSRLESNDAGVVYAGEYGDQPVVVVLLGEGAEADSYGRKRFHDALNKLIERDPDQVVQFDDDVDIAPWVALRADNWDQGLAAGTALLAPVTLSHVEQLGTATGPDFRPHWFRRNGTGRWRLWPLPWPRSLTQSGWWTFVAAFALIVAIAALALWIAIKIFENSPAPQQGPGPAPGPNPPPQPSTSGPTTTTPGPRPGPTGPPATGQPIPPIV
ncbi:MAG: hypothetical protein H0U36_08330 [Nocardioidaceae bacterium]|nr:hypothetical protein [Nocardioidaceae bacterium]